jgi:hypothetical protein
MLMDNDKAQEVTPCQETNQQLIYASGTVGDAYTFGTSRISYALKITAPHACVWLRHGLEFEYYMFSYVLSRSRDDKADDRLDVGVWHYHSRDGLVNVGVGI